LNGQAWWLAAEQIESMELTPDTLLVLLSGKKLMVKESPGEVIDRIVAFKRRIHAMPFLPVEKPGKEKEAGVKEEIDRGAEERL
jgi:flagellar protein FlbD